MELLGHRFERCQPNNTLQGDAHLYWDSWEKIQTPDARLEGGTAASHPLSPDPCPWKSSLPSAKMRKRQRHGLARRSRPEAYACTHPPAEQTSSQRLCAPSLRDLSQTAAWASTNIRTSDRRMICIAPIYEALKTPIINVVSSSGRNFTAWDLPVQ